MNTGEVVVRSMQHRRARRVRADRALDEPGGADAGAARRSGRSRSPSATRKLVEGYFALKALGPTRVKGVSEPVNVYEVTGLGPLRTRLQRSAGRGLHEVRRAQSRDGGAEAQRRSRPSPVTGRSSRRWRRRGSASRACSSSSRRSRSRAGWCWRPSRSRTARRRRTCR